MVVRLVSKLLLLTQPFHQDILGFQVTFYLLIYLLSIVGYLSQGKSHSRWLPLPLYFSLSNLATLFGLANVLRQRRAVTWQPGGSR